MKKKTYTTPDMKVVQLRHTSPILTASYEYEVNRSLQHEEVDEAW
jgi:hypothetical protein